MFLVIGVTLAAPAYAGNHNQGDNNQGNENGGIELPGWLLMGVGFVVVGSYVRSHVRPR